MTRRKPGEALHIVSYELLAARQCVRAAAEKLVEAGRVLSRIPKGAELLSTALEACDELNTVTAPGIAPDVERRALAGEKYLSPEWEPPPALAPGEGWETGGPPLLMEGKASPRKRLKR